MKPFMIFLLCVGSALAGTDQGMRDEFNGRAVDFFMGYDNLPSRLEMTPSENCVEGDMAMDDRQRRVYYAMREVTAKNRARVRREAEETFKIWPDKTLVYQFDSKLSKAMRAKFREAADRYEEATCIQFVEAKEGYSGDAKPLKVKGTGKGCYSTVGGPGGNLNLQENECDHIGVCLHEIGHALGVYHEQTRPDRDEYITVKEQNIKKGYANNFKLVERPLVDEYDLQSIMHYSSDAFSKDGRSETIVPKDENVKEKMGKQLKLSRIDIQKFNKMYDCYANCPAGFESQCVNGGVPSKNCACICPEEYTGPYCDIFNKRTACSKEFTDPTGVIRTPNYPKSYPTNADCTYAIKCPEGQKVSMTFSKFDVEGYGCFFDYLEIKRGEIKAEIYPDTYCDDDVNKVTLESKENLVLMRFKSDSMFTYKGFELEYQCV